MLARLPEVSQPVVSSPAVNVVPLRDQGPGHRLGAWITTEGADFTVLADDAEAVDLCLVDDDGNEKRRIALSRLPPAARTHADPLAVMLPLGSVRAG